MFCFLFLLALIVIFKKAAWSYDTVFAHPMLTEKAITLFNNRNSANKLTAEQAGWVIRGAEEEDAAPRWLNHFYNPGNGLGLTVFMPANIWANSSLGQSGYLLGDQSYQAAISAYANGDKKRAFIALGHVLHLLEDMAVPAHTRIDAHGGGDPYEKWVELNNVSGLSNSSPVIFNNLNEYFYSLANYSNRYFLSKGTTPVNLTKDKYYKKNNIGEEVKCLKGTVDNKIFCMATIRKDSVGKEYLIFDEFTNSDYYSLLAPKAISHGAGVIDLFFKQAKAEENKKLSAIDKLKQTITKTGGKLIGDFTGLFGKYQAAMVDYSRNLVGGNANNTAPAPAAGEPQISGQVLSAQETAAAPDNTNPPNPLHQGGENAEQNTTPLIPPLSGGSDTQPPLSPSPGEETKQAGENENANLPNIPLKEGQPPAKQKAPIFTAGDSTAPETTIVSAPKSLASSTSAEFIFASSESNSTFECDLNDGGWLPCASPHGLNDLADGSHIFKVRARDASNNTDQTPAEHNWTVDTAAPPITITVGPPEFASSTAANFQFETAEDYADYQCSLDANVWQLCAASTTAADLIEGRHSLEVRGLDRANNTGSSTSKTWLVDLTAPASTVAVLAVTYEATGFTVAWSGSDADATGSTTLASGIASYDIQYKINAGDWTNWINATTSTSTVFSLAIANGQSIYFRSRARDSAGNLENWPAGNNGDTGTTIMAAANHLLISEVQSGGSSASDFIELYNPTGSAISLNGYSTQYRGGGAHDFEKKDFFAGSEVKAKSYFLIAPISYAGSVSADFSVSFDLTAGGGTVFLVSATTKLADDTAVGETVVDRLAYGSGDHLFPEAAAYAPAPGVGQSLERKAAATSTAESLAVGGAQEKSGNSYDSNNNGADFVLRNSPRQQNSYSLIEPRAGATDSTPPVSRVAALNAIYEATGFTVSWSGEDFDDAGATTTASGIASFDLQYKINAGAWQNWINATTSTSASFSLAMADGQTAYFRSRARDNEGNLENWPANEGGDAGTTVLYSQNIITAGNTSFAYSNWKSGFSWKHTIAGDSPILIVAFHGDGHHVNSVSYNGQPMLLAAKRDYRQAYGYIAVSVYYLVNPSPGENDIQVGLSYPNGVAASAITFNNVDTADPIGLADTFFGVNPSIIHSVTTAKNNMMLMDAVTYNIPSSFTLSPEQNQTGYFIESENSWWYSATNSLYAGESYKFAESAGPQTMGWRVSGGYPPVHVVVGLNPKP